MKFLALSLLLAASAFVCAVDSTIVERRAGDKAKDYRESLSEPRLGVFWDSDGTIYEGSMNDLSNKLLNKRSLNCNSKEHTFLLRFLFNLF